MRPVNDSFTIDVEQVIREDFSNASVIVINSSSTVVGLQLWNFAV